MLANNPRAAQSNMPAPMDIQTVRRGLENIVAKELEVCSSIMHNAHTFDRDIRNTDEIVKRVMDPSNAPLLSMLRPDIEKYVAQEKQETFSHIPFFIALPIIGVGFLTFNPIIFGIGVAAAIPAGHYAWQKEKAANKTSQSVFSRVMTALNLEVKDNRDVAPKASIASRSQALP